MKLKPGFILRPYGTQWVAVAVGDARNKNLMLSMNKTGAFLWECLQKDTTEEALLSQMVSKYRVTPEAAQADLQQLLTALKRHGLLEY